jgi:TrmH family RNA methyltransferase
MLSKEKLKELARLKTKKGRKQQGKFLIEGTRLCEEALNSSWVVESFLLTYAFGEKTKGKEFSRKLERSNAKLIEVKAHNLEKLSDTVTPSGIMGVVKIRNNPLNELWKERTKLILALDGIRDPGNVGTLIRTADAFRADAVVLSDDTVELYNPKVVRSTMGSIFHLPVFDEMNLEKTLPELKKRNFKILGTDVHEGINLDRVDFSGKIFVLIGNEAEGLNKNLLALVDDIVHIPIRGKAESLNAAVAGGIILYEATRKTRQGYMID